MAEAPSGRITVQSHTIVYEDAALEAYGDGHIIIGEKSIIGGGRFVSRYQIRVGDRFLCSWNVLIQDFDSHPTDPVLRQYQVEKMVAEFYPRFDGGCPEEGDGKLNWAFPGDPILIGDDVWVCANAIIMKGANIGNGCIVAAGAIVLKGIYPPFSLIAGNPARVVKMLS